MEMAITVGTVRGRESYTLANKSAVVLSSQKLKNKIGKIKIEDSFKKCA